MAVLELKLSWVRSDAAGTTVSFALNTCARETVEEQDGETRERLRRTRRRTFERTFGARRTPEQCVALLLDTLRERAAEEGHEVYQ